MDRPIHKGELLTYNLTELVKPESYVVRLTPITRYGEGDATERVITYSGMWAPVTYPYWSCPLVVAFKLMLQQEVALTFISSVSLLLQLQSTPISVSPCPLHH